MNESHLVVEVVKSIHAENEIEAVLSKRERVRTSIYERHLSPVLLQHSERRVRSSDEVCDVGDVTEPTSCTASHLEGTAARDLRYRFADLPERVRLIARVVRGRQPVVVNAR